MRIRDARIGAKDGYISYTDHDWRSGAVPLRDGGAGGRAQKDVRRQAGDYSGKAHLQQADGYSSGRRGDGGDPVLLGNHSYGGRLCQFGDHEAYPGHRSNSGSQCGYYGYGLAFEFKRRGRLGSFPAASQALFLFPDPCDCRGGRAEYEQKRKAQRYGNDYDRLCGAYDRDGYHVERGKAAGGNPRIYQYSVYVFQPGDRYAGGACAYGNHPVFFGFRGYPSGHVRLRCGELFHGHSHYYGTECGGLRSRPALQCRGRE